MFMTRNASVNRVKPVYRAVELTNLLKKDAVNATVGQLRGPDHNPGNEKG